MLVLLLITIIICFMIYIFVGLNLSGNIENTILLVLFWIVYSMVCFTLFQVFSLGYLWSIVRKKTGPPGIRGLKGDRGVRGLSGNCGDNPEHVICIKELTELLNKLYIDNDPKNESIIENNKLKNNYLRRMVKRICSSSQYNNLLNYLQTIGRNNQHLIKYIKKIFTIWFNLIYQNDKNWFLKFDSDENYNWGDTNPFIEIKKYDLYHWGLVYSFRPLKVDICQSSEQYSNKELPDNEPKLKILKTNNYHEIYFNNSNKNSTDLMVFRPKTHKYEQEDYYPVGDIIVHGNDIENQATKKNNITKTGSLEVHTDYDKDTDRELLNGPDKESILITGDVKDPVRYERMWQDQEREKKFVAAMKTAGYAFEYGFYRGPKGEKMRRVADYQGSGNIWKPVAPEGYVCLGDIFTKWGDPNKPTESAYINNNPELNIKCVPSECVEEISKQEKKKELKWKSKPGKNNKLNYNGEIYLIGDGLDEANFKNSYNLFRSDNYYFRKTSDKIRKGDKFYRIKDDCLFKNRIKTKKVDSDFENLGIGWFGTPFNDKTEYSVFSFLGLVPEGILFNKLNEQSVYIVHYGGADVNKYYVYVPDIKTGEIDKKIGVKDDIISDETIISDQKKENAKYIFIIEKDKDNIYLRNQYNNKYLQIVKEEVGYKYLTHGNTVGETMFEFKPAFGVDFEDIDYKSKPKKKTSLTIDF